MKILRVKKTSFYDIFLLSGWKHHSRARFVNNTLQHISGLHLKEEQKTTALLSIMLKDK
jgi:hypothetical protein